MQQRSQRYVRRRRGWLGQTSERDDSSSGPGDRRPIVLAPGSSPAPRGRRGKPHFDERMLAARRLLNYTSDDEASVEATSSLLEPHIAAVASQIHRELLSDPETSAPFRDEKGDLDAEYVVARLTAFEEWLWAIVADPLDGATAEYVASVGLSYVRAERPGARIRGRHLVGTVSRVQSQFAALLAGSIADPKELAACVDAWCKHLMVHLDMLLAVYGSTEGSAHWY